MKPGYSRSFRLVCDPAQICQVEALLKAQGYEFEAEPFSPFCRRVLAEPQPLGSSLAAFFGYIYIQDRASMLPPLALAPRTGSAVLDMCASPGSKSGFLAQLTGHGGFVLANEPNPARLATLRANIQRLNLPQVGTCSRDGQTLDLPPGQWPYILLDPPCSGWGTAIKNPRVKDIWKGDKIKRLTGLQTMLLRKAESLLAPGGLLLYSTCTTNPAENEEQTAWAIKNLMLESVPLPRFPGFTYDPGCQDQDYLIIDGLGCGSQGFYLSLLRKPGAPASESGHERQSFASLPPSMLESPVFTPDLPGQYALFGESVRFIPNASLAMLPERFKWSAFKLGEFKAGRAAGSFRPDPRLRVFLPANSPKVVFEDIGEVNDFLSGKFSPAVCKDDSVTSLWWRDLPLGTAQIKKGRLISGFGTTSLLKAR